MSSKFREVDHSHEGTPVHDARRAMHVPLGEIMDVLHTMAPVKPGEEWTIPIRTSCGFDGEIVVRVRDLGSCMRRVRAGRES